MNWPRQGELWVKGRPSRGPPDWELFDQTAEFDPLDPEAEYDFDQSVSW